MAAIEEKAKTLDIKGTMITLIVSAFGFVAALFWRDAIKELIADVVPEGEGLAYSFGAAIFVTIIAIIAIYFVSRWMNISIREHAKKLKNVKKIKGKVGKIDNKIIGRDIALRRKKE